jgi:predicted GNAT superfamily acetyltransferase
MIVRDVTPKDASAWVDLRRALWPGEESEHAAEVAAFSEVANDASAAAHTALGFTEVGWIRCFRKDV